MSVDVDQSSRENFRTVCYSRAKEGKVRRFIVETLNSTRGAAGLDYVASDLCLANALALQEVTAAGDTARTLEQDFDKINWAL